MPPTSNPSGRLRAGLQLPTSKWLVSSAIGLGLGLAISAWYWIPALLEGRYAQLEHQTTGYLNYSNHFRGLDLVQPSLLFDYAIEAGRTPFAAGLAQAVLALLGAAAIVAWWIKRRRPEAQSAFFIAGLALATFLITPLSRPLWDNIPLLPFVQFPWRFLSVQAFFASLVIGYLAQRLPRPRLLAGVVGAALLAAAMLGLKPEYLPIGEEDVTVLQALADQLAVSISNVRLFQQVQESLDAERRAYGELSGEAWRDLLHVGSGLGLSRNRA